MLENIRHRMAQVKKSWEEDESGRQLYIARLRSSAIMERPVSLPVNMTLFDPSPRTPTTPPTLPVKSARRQLQARDSREMMTANTTNVLPPIVETPRFIAPPSSSPSRFNTGADVNAAMIKKRSLENRRSGLPTLSSRPRSRLFTASTTISSSSASPITMMADPLPRTYARLS
ncbi:hypothetical protein BDF19DRAFT_436216 [Syncephalis fuscata]|nr:hypothetical protein BDF19DRAFT_436216 [Syncephalis fuscata]